LGRRHFKKLSREYFWGFFRAAEIRAALFEKCGERFLGFGRSYAHSEFLVLESYRSLE
jgi:hypothetical protein